MYKKLSIALLGMLTTLALSTTVKAETVIEKVTRTGELTVGGRTDLVPYSYINDKKEWVGYSADILMLLAEELEKQIGKPITVRVVEQKGYGDERIAQLERGEIDIACESQFTWDRDRFVDFTTSYSLSGIRLVSKKGSQLGSPESLAGKRVAVGEDSLAGQVIKLVQPKAIVVPVKGKTEDIVAILRQGRVDAVAGDSIILAGLVAKLGLKDVQMSPVEPYARYGLACMVPQNNPAFLRLANLTIAKMMQGYVFGDKQYVDMVNKWFGPQGVVEIEPDILRTFFKMILLTQEQIPPTKP
ncbi:MAG TPA: extracellular substrate binding-like orphan protein GrrP [Leptolyngbyaceae cyanobacterium M33_DOE_097]|uniref:Transporter substrate-binding domain-containing protein n=1 Tax=Oscillatoriales cyanobacterium SpSt-418 TaxID=2282169 RepID=A0A7C3KI57_9CYAN|nr:extracellular substrate binding-like orphan protein GrrP [Leptolyngbyaceae cyanobacterium M33_DOE_097]